MTDTSPMKLPRWITIYALLVMFLVPSATVIFLFNPELSPHDLGSGAAVKFYVIRNIAAGLVTLFALYRRSAAMLLLMFIMRMLTDSADFATLVILGEDYLMMLAALIIMILIPSVLGIRTLWSAKG